MTNEEIAYMNGKRAAYRLLLRTAFNDFGEEQPLDRWRIEKMETITAMRALCKAIGIDDLNDWGDEDYLPSIIENVILRAIQSTGLQIRARQQEDESASGKIETPAAETDSIAGRMKLFVWENCLTDYTSGIMFAVAETADQARSELLKECNYIPERDLMAKPTVYSLADAAGFVVWGGG